MWKFRCNECWYSLKDSNRPEFDICPSCFSDDVVFLESYSKKEKEIFDRVNEELEKIKKDNPDYLKSIQERVKKLEEKKWRK